MNDPAKINIDDTRSWLNEQGLLEFMVKAIKGDVINNQRLSLRDRVHLASKLSNKILPDLKSVSETKTETIDVNIRYQATQELISSVTNTNS